MPDNPRKESLGTFDIGRTVHNHDARPVEVYYIYNEDGRADHRFVLEPRPYLGAQEVEPMKIVLWEWLLRDLQREVKLRRRKAWLKRFLDNLLKSF